MIYEEITYSDYNGVERTEKFYFNLNKAELLKMELGTTGGFTEQVRKIIDAKDQPALIEVFENFICMAYGEKSADGKRFMKEDENGYPLYKYFMQTEAYSQLYMKLSTDADAAARFINGVVPADLAAQVDTKAIAAQVEGKTSGAQL